MHVASILVWPECCLHGLQYDWNLSRELFVWLTTGPLSSHRSIPFHSTVPVHRIQTPRRTIEHCSGRSMQMTEPTRLERLTDDLMAPQKASSLFFGPSVSDLRSTGRLPRPCHLAVQIEIPSFSIFILNINVLYLVTRLACGCSMLPFFSIMHSWLYFCASGRSGSHIIMYVLLYSLVLRPNLKDKKGSDDFGQIAWSNWQPQKNLCVPIRLQHN